MSNIKLFESKQIRSIWDEQAQRWFFAVVDVVAVLSESQNPRFIGVCSKSGCWPRAMKALQTVTL